MCDRFRDLVAAPGYCFGIRPPEKGGPPGGLFDGARGLLTHLDRWTLKKRLLIPGMMAICAGTVAEQVLLFRRALSGVLDDSDSRAEAHANGDALATSSCSNSLMILGRRA